MQTTIGVFNSHAEALDGILELKKAGFSEKQLSIIGQAEIIDNHLQVKSNEGLKVAPAGIGGVLGPLLGALVGAGIVAIPGFGFLFGAGALVGALIGFDFGIIGGSIISVLALLGIKDHHSLKYEEHLKDGRFLLIAQGGNEELQHAHQILESHGKHIDLKLHDSESTEHLHHH